MFYWICINPNGDPDFFKAVLYVLPLDPSRLSDPALLLLVVAAVEPPRGGLASAAVTLRKGGMVILQDSDAISILLPVEMIPDPIPIPRGTRASWEGGRGTVLCLLGS